MKYPKYLIPFLAVVLPTIHFTNTNIANNKRNNHSKNDEKITTDETQSNEIILRAYTDSERFLRFANHSSHSSHSAHRSHSSHSSHESHTSGYNCNGCIFDVDEEFKNISPKTQFTVNK